MSWERVRLGDILTRRKDSIKVLPDEEYKLVTIRLYHKGVVLRSIAKGSEIKSPMSSIRSGDFILSGIDARNGAFGIVPEEMDGGIVTNDFWCLDPDESRIDTEFLLFLTTTDFFDNICKQSSDGTTQRIRLQKDKFFNYEISLPDIQDQRILIKKLKELESKKIELAGELNHQLDLVKQLRQSFLREAMQGKLTGTQIGSEENQETGQQLLEKIKAEKAQLIKDKKLKKEKELPPIKPEEIPFAIPEDWVWCRLGEVALYSEAGKSFKCVEVPINEGEWGVIKVSAVSWDAFLENQNKLYSKTEPNDTSARIENGDFLISRANTSELVGKSVVVKNITKNLLLSDKTIRFRFSTNVSSDFLNFCNNLKYAREYYAKMGTGSSPSMKNITRVHMNNLVIPLPPHFKQNLILNRIEHIQLICNQLESSIKQSQRQNEQLLQQVLREALEVEES